MASRKISIKEKIKVAQLVALGIAIFSAMFVALVISFFSSYSSVKKQWVHDTKKVHQNLENYERIIENHAVPSLYAVEKYLVENGETQESLNKARINFGLDGIFLINKEGKHHSVSHQTCFVDLVGTDHWYSFNLLDLDPSYKKMQSHDSFSKVVSTPIKWIYKCKPSKIVFGWSNALQKYIEIYYTIESFRHMLSSLEDDNPSILEITVANPNKMILISTTSSYNEQTEKVESIASIGNTEVKSELDKTCIYSAPDSAIESQDTYADKENIDRVNSDYYYSVNATFDNSKIIHSTFTNITLIALAILIMFAIAYMMISRSISPIVTSIIKFEQKIKEKRSDNFIFNNEKDEIENLHHNFDLLVSDNMRFQKQNNEFIQDMKEMVGSASLSLHQLKHSVESLNGAAQDKKTEISYTLENIITNLKSFFEEGSKDKVSRLFDSVNEARCSLLLLNENIFLHFPDNLNMTFVNLNANNTSAVLENIVSNAIEAKASRIDIYVKQIRDFIQVDIIDNGDPFPDWVVLMVNRNGRSKKKKSSERGMGIGLNETKNILWSAGGSIRIDKEKKKVELQFPIAPSPSWYLHNIDLDGINKLVVIDDTPQIGATIEKLLPSTYKLQLFDSPESFLVSFKEIESNTIYLVDYSFIGTKKTGVDIINEANLGKNAVLLTETLFKRIDKNYPNIKIMPKSRLHEKPFINIKNKVNQDDNRNYSKITCDEYDNV